MLRSVSARIAAVSVVAASGIAVMLTLFFVAETNLKRANNATTRSVDVSEAALNLRADVGTLQSALNAALRARTPANLAGWRHVRASWQHGADELRLKVQTPAQRLEVSKIRGLIQAYVSDYAEPVLDIARVAPSTARSSAVSSEGRIRIGSITREIDAITRHAARSAALRSRHADDFAHRATTVGLAALILTPLLLLVAALWFMRSVARPLRSVADAASAVAAGDFSMRLADTRKDEFGTLARAFNEMTSSLAANREELVARAERLEQSEQRKTELISIVSHEVRTPLASVLGFTRLLLERELGAAEREQYLQIINEEATRLAALVSDFLDIRLLEDKRFPLRTNHVDIQPLVVAQAERMLGHDAEHRLVLRVDERPVIVLGDERRLTQVLTNLLSNAAKFSPPDGLVTVGIDTTPSRVRVWVQNEGDGIAPEHADQLFEPFFRGGAPAAGIPGAGIGLALSRRIVEAHGGRIGFENVRGGVRFWFELGSLPEGAAAEPAQPAGPRRSHS